jgi:hypothetical protein
LSLPKGRCMHCNHCSWLWHCTQPPSWRTTCLPSSPTYPLWHQGSRLVSWTPTRTSPPWIYALVRSRADGEEPLRSCWWCSVTKVADAMTLFDLQ